MIKVTNLAEKLRVWCCKMVEETRVRGKTLCSPCCSTSGVRKNARFAHIMVNFGLVVRGKRFSAHEAVFLIARQCIVNLESGTAHRVALGFDG